MAVLATATLVAGCGLFESDAAPGPTGAPGAGSSVGHPAADLTGAAPDVDPSILPQESVAPMPAARLADGLVPPTNRWFSGLVFGDEPLPVFPVPLAFGVTDGGFAFGLPDVEITEQSILGPFVPQVGVDVGAATVVVTAYDTTSVTLDLLDGGGTALGTVTLVEGSPVLRYTAATDQSAALAVAFDAVDGLLAAEAGGREYVLVGAEDALSDDGRSLDLSAGDSVAWFPVPDDAPDGAVATLAEAAAHPVTGTTLAYGVADDAVTTAITYETGGDAPGSGTVVVRLPHQGESDGATCDLGTYATVRGTVDVCTASTLAWTSPAVEPAGALDVTGLGEEEKTELADQVRADASALEPRPSDTYFGGKALARDANLLSLAEQLGLDDVATPLREDLAAALREWAGPAGCEESDARCFVYDPEVRSVVGRTPSFGSDELNDHHFHYGYFLYAAGAVAAGDPALAADLAPVLDLLAADVAAGASSGDFPALRVFDAYAGHSWASGYAPFADGNNQESASEAVSAWNGLALWAQASGDATLETQARWLLSAEAASARAYWTDFDRDDPALDGFGHTVTSLVWGGKRDWATWFSAEPSAMLGILVLPMQPVAGYLAGDPERVRANLDEALGGPRDDPASWDVMFGDQLLMYAALAGPDDAAAALDVARALPDERVDDGNTRSYLLAWLLVHATA
ncbi:glycosyl hydrolase [Cellulosimicrobium protaetiae]|uniref:glucan endo-1,3-beta-D-glucosidase n=1 Tax=Cellulosimicrobium protaetiae TaxID=2587808 RepID=A0A6M5UEJ3_9MICO|nr:glycosyl hydrolase [Cellulosimicrobium protaetiae]QJW35675.1 1,3-beta-glucanase [Cellulosimicrobium protaetiae]